MTSEDVCVTEDNHNPLAPFLERGGHLIIDGGLATQLETAGYALDDALWSARLLTDEPQAIAAVHRNYLEAGADCIISASYQASAQGFIAQGHSRAEAYRLLRSAAQIAVRVRDEYWRNAIAVKGRCKPLVAASVGPYGACQADGSEYTGDYRVGPVELKNFHRERLTVLAESPADLLALETIPSCLETEVLLDLLAEDCPRGTFGWISFSCRNGQQISDGTPIERVAAMAAAQPRIGAIGVNCTAPEHLPSLIERLRACTDKPIVAYPNSGECYHADTNSWQGITNPGAFGQLALVWRRAGAALIGGCCRTGPDHIRRIRAALDA